MEMAMQNEATKDEVSNAVSGRVDLLVVFLESLPDINEYMYQDEEGWHVTNEWLCGTFAGQGFFSETKNGAVEQLMNYLDRHIRHKSMVGHVITESGWPNLDSVKNYLIDEFYSEAEYT